MVPALPIATRLVSLKITKFLQALFLSDSYVYLTKMSKAIVTLDIFTHNILLCRYYNLTIFSHGFSIGQLI